MKSPKALADAWKRKWASVSRPLLSPSEFEVIQSVYCSFIVDEKPDTLLAAVVVSGSPNPDKWAVAEKAVDALGAFADNWDGRGSEAVPLRIVASAVQLCRHLRSLGQRAPDDAYPMPDGSIMLEWQEPGYKVTRYEVDGVGRGQKIVSSPEMPTQFSEYRWDAEDDYSDDVPSLPELVDWEHDDFRIAVKTPPRYRHKKPRFDLAS